MNRRTHRKSISDLVEAASDMPGGTNAALYSDTAAQICKRSVDLLFKDTNMLLLAGEQIVLDIGCGTGETTQSLVDRLPCVKEVVAIDKSQDFIEYAQKVNSSFGIDYIQMDAELDWPDNWSQKYTTVFSNYVFHWIKDHEKLLSNIYNCLQPNGDFVTQFFHSAMPTEDEMLAGKKAAISCGVGKEMQNAIASLKRHLPVWKDSQAYEALLTNLGFLVRKCQIIERCYVCESRFERAGMTLTVSPFMHHVPKEKRLEFAIEYVKHLKDPYTIHHKAVIVHAVKM